jgi:hypothetical protein
VRSDTAGVTGQPRMDQGGEQHRDSHGELPGRTGVPGEFQSAIRSFEKICVRSSATKAKAVMI